MMCSGCAKHAPLDNLRSWHRRAVGCLALACRMMCTWIFSRVAVCLHNSVVSACMYTVTIVRSVNAAMA